MILEMSDQTDNQNIQTCNTPVSFWELLDHYEVIIPIIQRDYAQGREDKHKLRIEFFGQLISSLKESIPCKLDFVYACPRSNNDPSENTESEVIYPLDGQQRLTSLWLLHWYIAFKSGVLIENAPYYDESVGKRLKRFSYETRTSSREFCERMCEKLVGENTGNISNYISGQPWFTRKYKEDPTVTAMLRSLSDPTNFSGFEQLLEGNLDYKALWDKLCSASCPLKFYFRNTKNERILNSDDLYIKMNARGKKLTDFENFKAELFSFKSNGTELFRGENDNFISHFENAWTNYFWPLRSVDNVVDYLIFEFFNRQALNFLILHEDLDKQKALYDHLIKHQPFSSIDVYSPILSTEFKTFYYQIWEGIIKSGEKARISLFYPYDFDFIPVYSSEENKGYEIKYRDSIYYVTPTTMRNQVLTHAASIYFSQLYSSKQDFNNLYFNDWMMFVRNLMDNSGMDTYKGIKPLLEFISLLANKSLSIISSLKDLAYDEVDLPSQAKNQLLEEIQKANKIYVLRNAEEDDDTSLETMIRSAEKDYPFDGAIRFLMYNGEGKVDWTTFELKKRHFDDFLAIEHKNKGISARMLRCLYRHIINWDDMGRPWLNSSYSSWKDILLNNDLLYAVHAMLLDGIMTNEELAKFKSPFSDPIQRGTHEELVGSKFLHQTTWGDFYFKPREHRAVIWRCSVDWKNYLLGTARNRLICMGINNGYLIFPEGIENNRMLGDGEHLWGENFYFDIAGNNTSYIFYWRNSEVRRRNHSDKLIHDVYLVRRDNQKYAAVNPNDLGITIEYDCLYEDFIQRLENLLGDTMSK